MSLVVYTAFTRYTFFEDADGVRQFIRIPRAMEHEVGQHGEDYSEDPEPFWYMEVRQADDGAYLHIVTCCEDDDCPGWRFASDPDPEHQHWMDTSPIDFDATEAVLAKDA